MPKVFGVLAGKLQLGGHDWISGPVSIAKNDVLRSATLEDFAFFRVDPTSPFRYTQVPTGNEVSYEVHS